MIPVDYGSTDATPAVLEELTDDYERVSVETLRANAGKAEAARQALLLAFDRHPIWVGYCYDMDTPASESLRLNHNTSTTSGLST